MTEEPLRIALVAPPWYPIPPPGYGGIERMVHLLAEHLTERGNRVAVFCRQGSKGNFEALPLAPASWGEALGGREQQARECTYLHTVYESLRRRPFDVVHDHTGYTGMLLAASLTLPAACLATLHGDLNEADGDYLRSIDSAVSLVAISEAQQSLVAGVRWAGYVHNAVDLEGLEFSAEKDDYLLTLARICPEKGQHLAVEIAREAGMPLVLAGKVDEQDRSYFEERIEPHLNDGVQWLEDVGGRERARLLARARALLFPIQWDEPFGLAMGEAMVSGTPVVASARGAAVEVVDEGVTGFLAREDQDLVGALRQAVELDPERCAKVARERFSPARMAGEYDFLYRREVEQVRNPRPS